MEEKKLSNKDIQSDYKVMMDMVDEAKENYNMYLDLLKNGLDQDDISFGRTKFLFDAYSEKDIKDLDDELAKEMLEKIRKPGEPDKDSENPTESAQANQVEKDNTMDEWINSLCEDYYESKIKGNTEETPETTVAPFDEYYASNYGEMIRAILLSLKSDMVSLTSSEKDVKNLESQAGEVGEEYVNYMCSPEYENRKKERIQAMKEKLNSTTENLSELEKKKLERKVDELESIYDLSFLFKRLENDTDKEVKNIKNTFFDDKRSAYIIERYKNKMKAVGFNADVYRFFFNLEEKYLPEEYQVYNNLFLFHIMRFIAYVDANSELGRSYVRTINSSISKLVYEKYEETQKEEFIGVIEKFLDYFKEYRDAFDKNNFLHPNHPKRIAKEKEEENELREMIYTNLTANNYEVTEEVKVMPTSELKEMYKKVLDEIEESKKDEKVKDLKEFIEKTSPKGEVEADSNEETVDDATDDTVEDSSVEDAVETEEDTDGMEPVDSGE